MVSVDFTRLPRSEKSDRLGFALFLIHLGVGAFVVFGWAIPSHNVLGFYLVFLPAMAGQWVVNRGSCVINNLESWFRSGRWRDAANPQEGRFFETVCLKVFRRAPDPARADAVCYGGVTLLWILGFGHFLDVMRPSFLAVLIG